MTLLIAALLAAQTAAEPPASAAVTSVPASPRVGDPVPLPGPRTFGILDNDRFDRCHDTAADDAVAGLAEANRWLMEGGSYLARQCLGFAQAKGGLFDAAARSFEQAAQEAEAAHDWRAANLWAQGGNAALAANDPPRARRYLDAALAQGHLTGLALGEAYLDRARAALAMSDWAAGRTDLDAAKLHAAQDPLVWLLSATLARRQEQLPTAQADIAMAATLAPRDASIALEAGNIAAAAQQFDAARRSWQSAVELGGGAADTARTRITELDAFLAEQQPAEPAATAAATPSGATPEPPR